MSMSLSQFSPLLSIYNLNGGEWITKLVGDRGSTIYDKNPVGPEDTYLITMNPHSWFKCVYFSGGGGWLISYISKSQLNHLGGIKSFNYHLITPLLVRITINRFWIQIIPVALSEWCAVLLWSRSCGDRSVECWFFDKWIENESKFNFCACVFLYREGGRRVAFVGDHKSNKCCVIGYKISLFSHHRPFYSSPATTHHWAFT